MTANAWGDEQKYTAKIHQAKRRPKENSSDKSLDDDFAICFPLRLADIQLPELDQNSIRPRIEQPVGTPLHSEPESHDMAGLQRYWQQRISILNLLRMNIT